MVEAEAEAAVVDDGSGERKMPTILTVNMHGIGQTFIGRGRRKKRNRTPRLQEVSIFVLMPATMIVVIIRLVMKLLHGGVMITQIHVTVSSIIAKVAYLFTQFAGALNFSGTHEFACELAVRDQSWLASLPNVLTMMRIVTGDLLY